MAIIHYSTDTRDLPVPKVLSLSFKYMEFPFDLPEDLVEQYILPKCHSV